MLNRHTLLLLLLFLTIASPAFSITIDKGSLNVPIARLENWSPPTVAEANYEAAKAYQQYDVTCVCQDTSCNADPATGNKFDNAGAGCTEASNTLPFPYTVDSTCTGSEAPWVCCTGSGVGTCAACAAVNPAAEAGNVTADFSAMQCMMDNAANNTVVYVPANTTVDMGDTKGHASLSEIIDFDRSNVVLRGESMTTSILRSTTVDGTEAVFGSPGCSGIEGQSNSGMCDATVISVATDLGSTNTAWTAGYALGTTQVTVTSAATFTGKEFMLLTIDNAFTNCLGYFPSPAKTTGNLDRALMQIVRISSVDTGANTVTFTPPLMMDYDEDKTFDTEHTHTGANCTSAAKAYVWNALTNVGIEKLLVTTHTTVALGSIGNSPLVNFAGTADSWMVGVHVKRADDAVFRTKNAAFNWIQGNIFEQFGIANFSTEGFNASSGSVSNVFENNAFKDFVTAFYFHQGVAGNVTAYNYLRHTTANGKSPETSILGGHGTFTRGNLFEGNDHTHQFALSDKWWGISGVYQTSYRNRQSDDEGGFRDNAQGWNRDGCTTDYTCDAGGSCKDDKSWCPTVEAASASCGGVDCGAGRCSGGTNNNDVCLTVGVGASDCGGGADDCVARNANCDVLGASAALCGSTDTCRNLGKTNSNYCDGQFPCTCENVYANDKGTWIGNTSTMFAATVMTSTANALTEIHDIDGINPSGKSTSFVKNSWWEKNVFRNESTCTGDTGSNRCGFHLDSAQSDTSCGTAANDCNTGSGPNGILGNNYSETDATTGSSDHDNDTIPASLYRTEAPSWWCQEACDWEAQTGIGAWGDDFGAGTPCKLPAQILYEGGVCTALATTTPTYQGVRMSWLEQIQLNFKLLMNPVAVE